MTTEMDQKRQRLQALVTEGSQASHTNGINHLAIFALDLEATPDFYVNVLGMPVIRITANRDEPQSTHMNVDIGNGTSFAFFDFPHVDRLQVPAPEGAGGMMHVAIPVPDDRYVGIEGRLKERGIEYRRINNSVCFKDPNGMNLELMVVQETKQEVPAVANYKVALVPGDGIGPEVIAEGTKALDALAARDGFMGFQYTHFPWGSDYYRETGRMMPEDGLDQLRTHDAILFGAVGDPQIPDHVTLHGLILPIRRGFDQGVCFRPSLLFDGVQSPLSGKNPGDIDFVVFRENTEGEYANMGGFLYQGTPEEVSLQTSVFTRRGTERIIRAAFEYAQKRNKGRKVTSVTKSNAMQFGMVFWDRVFEEVAAQYPDIETESLLVDRACMDLVRHPEAFDVIVASNLFGDILTDIGAIVTGSMGLAPSANINPDRKHPSMFEPVHGAAFDITGKGLANPLATILAVAMMLDHFGEDDAAAEIDRVVKHSLKEGTVRTADLGGSASTSQVGDEIVHLLTDRRPAN